MKLILSLLLLLPAAASAQAQTFVCSRVATDTADDVPDLVRVDPEKPALELIWSNPAKSIAEIDDTYLGLYTNPMIWALRRECEFKQEPKSAESGAVLSMGNFFDCLLADEFTPIAKISAQLDYNYSNASGKYAGYWASLITSTVIPFEVRFSDCREQPESATKPADRAGGACAGTAEIPNRSIRSHRGLRQPSCAKGPGERGIQAALR